jgi:2-hydroxychromene-2-carboxylate isomerase
MKPGPPRFYFSFWSPYSWVATRLLEERLDGVRFGIRYTPYWPPDEESLRLLRSLGGDFLYQPMKREKHLYILQDIKRMVGSLGFPLCWPIDEKPWLDLPHLAYLAAQRLGKGSEFFWAAHRARWEQRRNVCSTETIRELAREVGLPPEIADAPADPSIRREGAEALLAAYHDGVFGVPFFITGRDKFWGVDRLGHFVATLQGVTYRYLAGGALSGEVGLAPARDEASPPASEAALAAVGAYDKDCAGGCG